MHFVQINSGVTCIANLSLQTESLETKFPTRIETSISTVNKHQKTTGRIGYLKTPTLQGVNSCIWHLVAKPFTVYSVHILKRWETCTVPRLWICR